MKKRWIASILTVAMMLSVISPLSAYADDGDDVLFEDDCGYADSCDDGADEEGIHYYTEEALSGSGDDIALASARTYTLDDLRQKYPAGKYWNHVGSSQNNPEGWTDYPCTDHSQDNYYHGTLGWARQCAGYAEQLGYCYAGSDPQTWEKRVSKSAVDSLKAGDIVRYRNDGHSIFITKVEGENVWLSDCNWGVQGKNGWVCNCNIRWDAKITKSDIKKSFTSVRVCPVGESASVPSTDTCSTQYAGWYKVKSSDGISVNSGHNFGSEVSSIPNGSVLYVTKASGLGTSQIGHIQYEDGQERYVAMNLLEPMTGIENRYHGAGIHDFFDASATVGGILYDWGNLNEKLQVRVVADSGQIVNGVADQDNADDNIFDFYVATPDAKSQGNNHRYEIVVPGLSKENHSFSVQVYTQGNWVEINKETVSFDSYDYNLAVDKTPDKTEYTIGDTLDTSGLVLKENVTIANTTIKLRERTVTDGFTCTPTTLDTAGTQTITVNYDGLSTSFDVTVKEKETPNPTPDNKDHVTPKPNPDNNTTKPDPDDTTTTKPDPDDTTTTKPDQNEDKLEFQMRPIKTKYTVGDTLDDSGMVLKWTHQGKEELVYYGYTCTPEILDQVGTQKITVSYKGLSVEYPVEVKAKDTTSSGTTTRPSGGTTTTKPNNTVKPNNTPKPDDTVTTPSDDGSGMAAAILLGGAVVVVGGIVMMAMAAAPVEVRATAISSDHAVLANAPVALLQGDRVVAQTVTDANGQFHFNVKKGSYTLRVTTINAETGETVTRYAAISAPANGSVVTF